MRFGLLGVTEGQFLVMAILLSTGIFGADVWKTPVYQWIQARHVLMVCGSVGGIYQAITSIKHVFEYIHSKKIPFSNAMYPIIQFTITMILCTFYALSPYDPLLFAHHPYVILLIFGCVFGYQISRLIIFHVANESYIQFFYVLLPLPLLTLNAYTPYFFPSYRSKLGLHASTGSQHLLFNSEKAAFLYLAVLVVQYTHFLIVVVREICEGLNITCFSIQGATPPKDVRHTVSGSRLKDSNLAVNTDVTAGSSNAPRRSPRKNYN